MRALIVDDEMDIGVMTSIILKTKRIHADTVISIREANEKIRHNRYDLFILDLNLPDGNGFDLIPSIRMNNTDARIVIISAHDGTIELKQARKFNVDLFVRKPFSRKQILEAVDQITNK